MLACPLKICPTLFFWVYHYIFQIKAFLCVVTKLSLLAVAEDEQNNSNLSVCNDRENETGFLVLSGGLPPAVSFFTAVSLTFFLEASLALRIYPQCSKHKSHHHIFKACPCVHSTSTWWRCICAFVSALIVSLIKSGFSAESFYVRQLDWKPSIWIVFNRAEYNQSVSFVESFDKNRNLYNISTTRQVQDKSFLYPWLALARDYFNNTVSSSIATGQ